MPAGDGITLRSEPGSGNVSYLLVGRPVANGLRGVIEEREARAGGAADSTFLRADVMLTPVLTKNQGAVGAAPAGHEDPSGLYSDVSYNEDSGDLVGRELVLLPDESGRWTAVLAEYDSDARPRAATGLTWRGDTLRFAVLYRGNVQGHYRVIRAGDGMAFEQEGSKDLSDAGEGPSVLRRKRSLATLLTGTRR